MIYSRVYARVFVRDVRLFGLIKYGENYMRNALIIFRKGVINILYAVYKWDQEIITGDWWDKKAIVKKYFRSNFIT